MPRQQVAGLRKISLKTHSSCSPPRKSLVKGERFIRVEGKAEFFLCLRRMSSPPVGLVQWLSYITSNPQQRLRCAMSLKGYAKNGGAPSRQLRRGIEPRLHKIKTKKTKHVKKCRSTQNRNRETCAVDQLRAPSTRRPHDGNNIARSNPGKMTHRSTSPRSQATQTTTPTFCPHHRSRTEIDDAQEMGTSRNRQLSHPKKQKREQG